MKQYIYTKLPVVIFCALLCVFAAGCISTGKPQAGPESSAVESPPQAEASSKAEDSEAIESESSLPERNLQNMTTVYLYQPERAAYSPVQLVTPANGISVPAIIEMVAQELGIKVPLPEILQVHGILTLNFNGGFVDGVLDDGEVEEAFLASVCTTAVRSNLMVKSVRLHKDGGPYVSANKTLELDQLFQWPEMTVGGTTQDYDRVRAAIVYEGLYTPRDGELRYDIVETYATGRLLTDFLALAGNPGREIESTGSLDNSYVLAQALVGVQKYCTYNYGQAQIYRPELNPIAEVVGGDSMALKEHVEQAARDLFGDMTVTHESVGDWVFHSELGVYTPSRGESASLLQPVVFDYQDLGDRYQIHVTYIYTFMGVYQDISGNTIEPTKLLDTITNLLPRQEVVVAKVDGGLELVSFRYLQGDDDEFAAVKPR